MSEIYAGANSTKYKSNTGVESIFQRYPVKLNGFFQSVVYVHFYPRDLLCFTILISDFGRAYQGDACTYGYLPFVYVYVFEYVCESVSVSVCSRERLWMRV